MNEDYKIVMQYTGWSQQVAKNAILQWKQYNPNWDAWYILQYLGYTTVEDGSHTYVYYKSKYIGTIYKVPTMEEYHWVAYLSSGVRVRSATIFISVDDALADMIKAYENRR